MTGPHAAWLGGAAVVATIVGCEQPSIAPPDIHWGVTECEACRMSIVDERFACALVRVNEQGRLESLAFDDLNCLVESMDEAGPAAKWTVFVRDAGATGWMDATMARFVRGLQFKSPMAGCVGAFASEEEARRAAPESPSRDFAAVAEDLRQAPILEATH